MPLGDAFSAPFPKLRTSDLPPAGGKIECRAPGRGSAGRSNRDTGARSLQASFFGRTGRWWSSFRAQRSHGKVLLCGLLGSISLHPLRIGAARGFGAPSGGGRAEPKGVQPAALAQAGSRRRRGRTPARVGGIGAASGKASVSGRATHPVTPGGADFGLGMGGRRVCPAEQRSPLLSQAWPVCSVAGKCVCTA